jgi:hypothetical protein
VAVDIAVLEDGEGVADTRYPEVRAARLIQDRVIGKRPITGDSRCRFIGAFPTAAGTLGYRHAPKPVRRDRGKS